MSDEQARLLAEQYRDASNLNARIELHRRFSVTRQGWPDWLFDQLDIPDRASILELGCGPGSVWLELRDRVPPGWELTLTDLSPGMIEEARRNTAGLAARVFYAVADAQQIPFPDERFDAVIANFMLYHVPDRPRAYAEIQRVLRPGSRFYAATNGKNHMGEIKQLFSTNPIWPRGAETDFSLETGRAELEEWFDSVELRRYPDGLVVTEAGPLIDFIFSTQAANELPAEEQEALVNHVRRMVAESGAMQITKDSGLFIARKPQR